MNETKGIVIVITSTGFVICHEKRNYTSSPCSSNHPFAFFWFNISKSPWIWKNDMTLKERKKMRLI